MKALLPMLHGTPVGAVRPPLLPLDESKVAETLAELRSVLAK